MTFSDVKIDYSE